jgi:hypothetical protein
MYFRLGEGSAPRLTPFLGGSSRRYLGEAALATEATCAAYERGEIEKSRTQAGHVAPDVVQHARGLLIRDFGVDWRHVRETIKGDAVLQQWLTTILQLVRGNPTTRIRISGFSDCVGTEKNNLFLRRGRAHRVHDLLREVAGPGWRELQPRITFVDAAPAGDYVADNNTADGRATNRGVLIELSREVTFEPEIVTANPPDTIERIVRRGLELVQRLDQFGIRITVHQQQRIRCILLRLSRPGFDDRYLTAQGVLDYNNQNVGAAQPYYANATQWLLPEFAIRSRRTTPDDVIWRTLVKIDDDIIQGRAKINYYYDTHGAATPIRIQRLRDWVAQQQDDARSIYQCYR